MAKPRKITDQEVKVETSSEEAVDLSYTHSRQRLSTRKLEAMSKSEIRAVAADRGYTIATHGGHADMVRRFLECQENEQGLHTPGDEMDEQGKPIPDLPVTEEFPVIDSSKSDEELLASFESEAKAKGYAEEESARIAKGRLADLRAGGDGYTVRSAPSPLPSVVQ